MHVCQMYVDPSAAPVGPVRYVEGAYERAARLRDVHNRRYNPDVLASERDTAVMSHFITRI